MVLHSDSLLCLSTGSTYRWQTFYSRSLQHSFTIDQKGLKGNKGLCEIFSKPPQALAGNTFYIAVPPIEQGYVPPMLPEGKLKTFFQAIGEDANPCIIAYRTNEELFR